MKSSLIRGLFLLTVTYACVDRVDITDLKISDNFPVVVDGFISNEPGPYRVLLSSSFDIESSENIKVPVNARKIVVTDDLGATEELSLVRQGVYEIRAIQGRVGGIYKMEVHLNDGRVYESIPDTLRAPGKVDTVMRRYEEVATTGSLPVRRFLISANATGLPDNSRYMWSLNATYKAITQPEAQILKDDKPKGCYFLEYRCNFVPPCSGYRNMGTSAIPNFFKLYPCDCCTCWYNIYSPAPVISDDKFVVTTEYNNISVGEVPVTGWVFSDKVHIEVMMKSLSRQSFTYFRSIRDQRRAVNSLFQPATGKIPLNFVQTAGPAGDLYGIFYAAGVARKGSFVRREQVPNHETLTTMEQYDALKIGWVSCLEMFPNASNVKPTFWED